MTAFDYVYRWNAPAGAKGKRCRIDKLAPQRHGGQGDVNLNHESIALAFEDGSELFAPRDAVLPVASVMGRRVLAMAARGFTKKPRRKP